MKRLCQFLLFVFIAVAMCVTVLVLHCPVQRVNSGMNGIMHVTRRQDVMKAASVARDHLNEKQYADLMISISTVEGRVLAQFEQANGRHPTPDELDGILVSVFDGKTYIEIINIGGKSK
jgi:hypothetical protein